jgi:hypothetical protein
MPTLHTEEYNAAMAIKFALRQLERHLAAAGVHVARDMLLGIHDMLSEAAQMPRVAALLGDVTPFSGGGNKPDDD